MQQTLAVESEASSDPGPPLTPLLPRVFTRITGN